MTFHNSYFVDQDKRIPFPLPSLFGTEYEILGKVIDKYNVNFKISIHYYVNSMQIFTFY